MTIADLIKKINELGMTSLDIPLTENLMDVNLKLTPVIDEEGHVMAVDVKFLEKKGCNDDAD